MCCVYVPLCECVCVCLSVYVHLLCAYVCVCCTSHRARHAVLGECVTLCDAARVDLRWDAEHVVSRVLAYS